MKSYNLTKGNCKTQNNDNIFKFISGGISNLSEDVFMDLSTSDIYVCDNSRRKIKLDTKSYEAIEANFLALHSGCDSFLLSNNINNKSNDSSIDLSISSVVNGLVEDFTIDLSYKNIIGENVYNWNNFHNQYYNYDVTNWDTSTESWLFYSTPNSSTNLVMFNDFDVVGYELQILSGNDKTFFIEHTENLNKITFELKYSSGLINLISVKINGRFVIDTNKILSLTQTQTQTNDLLFFRRVSEFDEITKHFVSNSTNIKTYYVYNNNDHTIQIDSLVGFSCDDDDLLTESDCC